MTRDDLEQLDTKSLRALARERLAQKARSLRTRAALLAALTRSLHPPATFAAPVPPAGKKRPSKRTGAAVGSSPTSVPKRTPAVALPPTASPEAPARTEDVLVDEGFFLSHAEARPRQRRRDAQRAEAAAAPAEKTGAALAAEAPARAGEELPHLLARDPTTLFLFWDFRRDLERGAAFGLTAPRVRFQLYDGDTVVRTLEAPLGRGSLYLEGLEPGHSYSVEALLVGSHGHARPIGRHSAPVRLAPAVPSANLEVEVVRHPLERPLARGAARPSTSTPARLDGRALPTRLELPASLEWRGGPGPAGPRSGRP